MNWDSLNSLSHHTGIRFYKHFAATRLLNYGASAGMAASGDGGNAVTGGGGGASGKLMPCIASQSSVGIISIASHGQPSRKAPSGPLLVHF
jgi:hypothetical protein